MTPRVIEQWHAFLDGGHRAEDLDGLLADECVFYSPAVFSPQEGRAKTASYLNAAATLFDGTDFRYVEEWYGRRSAILEFAATIDGSYVNGIDMIHWNEEDRIVSFKVMIRPFRGLNVIMPRMAKLLETS